MDAFSKEDDITIAYPTQQLYLSNERKDMSTQEHEIV
jgi:hypothetical protein